VSGADYPAGYRRGTDLPAARLAEVRQQSDPLNLLICEPDPDVLVALMEDLAELNVRVVASGDGARALLDAGRTRPELLLLGADLPVLSAADLIRTLRQVSDSRVIVGAGEGQADLVSAAVAAGADRVMPRPYSAAQLRAAMLGIRSSQELDSVLIRAGSLTVDPLAYEVRLGNRLVPMSVRELEVLVYLIRHHKRIVSVAELQTALWADEQLSPTSNAVAVTVMHLRARLAEGSHPGIIQTIRRRGYRFYPPGDSPLISTPAQSGRRSASN
jgi:DNA-binding response OmpR family regulator